MNGLTFDQSDIAWKTDRDVRFENPTNGSGAIDTGGESAHTNIHIVYIQ